MDQKKMLNKIKRVLDGHPKFSLCILFGSVANYSETPESDLDIAVASEETLNISDKRSMIEAFAVALGRPVDLIDLQTTNGTLLHQILTKGRLIFCNDHFLYAEIMKRMLFNQSDMMPYHFRILKERREKWING